MGEDHYDLMPEERAFVAKAVPARQQEFAAGRNAARAALGEAAAIPSLPDRSPLWPEGWKGSITHSAGLALAGVSQSSRFVGLDVEDTKPLPSELWDTVLHQCESAWVMAQDEPGLWAKVVFSAKEAAYKAQYPITRALFGFDVMEIQIDRQSGRLRAEFQSCFGPFKRGDALLGRFARSENLILTGFFR